MSDETKENTGEARLTIKLKGRHEDLPNLREIGRINAEMAEAHLLISEGMRRNGLLFTRLADTVESLPAAEKEQDKPQPKPVEGYNPDDDLAAIYEALSGRETLVVGMASLNRVERCVEILRRNM